MTIRAKDIALTSRVFRASLAIPLVVACALAGFTVLSPDTDADFAATPGVSLAPSAEPAAPLVAEALAPLELRAVAIAPLPIAPASTASARRNSALVAPMVWIAGDRFATSFWWIGGRLDTPGFWRSWPDLQKLVVARLRAAPRANPVTVESANTLKSSLDAMAIDYEQGTDVGLEARQEAWAQLVSAVIRAEVEHLDALKPPPPFTDEQARLAVTSAYPDAQPLGADCDMINWGAWSAGNTPPPPARIKIAADGWLAFTATSTGAGGAVTYYGCY